MTAPPELISFYRGLSYGLAFMALTWCLPPHQWYDIPFIVGDMLVFWWTTGKLKRWRDADV